MVHNPNYLWSLCVPGTRGTSRRTKKVNHSVSSGEKKKNKNVDRFTMQHFHLLLLTALTTFTSSSPELDRLYLDPSPYLNIISPISSATTTASSTVRRVRISPSQHLEWLKQRDTARQHLQHGDLDIAKQQFQSVIITKGQFLPSRVVAGLHLELGDTLFLMGDDDGCHHHFLEAQAFVPESYLPHFRLAKLSVHLGNFDEGIGHYKHALFFNNTHLMSLHNLGSLLFLQCKVEEAWHYLSVALHGSDHPELYQRVSLSLSEEEEEEEEVQLRSARALRNGKSNTALENFHYASSLTSHIMGVFEERGQERRSSSSSFVRVAGLFQNIEESSDTDRTEIVGYALSLLSHHLHGMGLYEEAMQIRTTLNAALAANGRAEKEEEEEEELSEEENGESRPKRLLQQQQQLGVTFLAQYAHAVPKLLDPVLLPSDIVLNEMWERRTWIASQLASVKRRRKLKGTLFVVGHRLRRVVSFVYVLILFLFVVVCLCLLPM